MSRELRQRTPEQATKDPSEGPDRWRESWSWLLLCVLLVAFAESISPAPGADLQLAYLDPGSGSFLIQALVALVAGIAVALRTYWDRVKSFLGLSSKDENEAGADVPGRDD